jgi:adenosine/AMP kinase
MANYASLSSQITQLTTDMTTSLTGGTYTSQDYAYYANALQTLGTMLGVTDIVAATANQVTSITTAGTTQVGLVNTAGTTQVTAVNSAGTTQLSAINTTATNLTTLAYMGVLA